MIFLSYYLNCKKFIFSMNREKKIQLLFICLQCLDLYHNDKINNFIRKELYKEPHQRQNPDYAMVHLNQKHLNMIIIIYVTNQLTFVQDTRDKILSILINYCSKGERCNSQISELTYKYLTRFHYQYKHKYPYTKYKKINSNPAIANEKIKSIAMYNLYLIYKTISNKNIYFLHEYLENNQFII